MNNGSILILKTTRRSTSITYDDSPSSQYQNFMNIGPIAVESRSRMLAGSDPAQEVLEYPCLFVSYRSV
jgi:hypothetical protein